MKFIKRGNKRICQLVSPLLCINIMIRSAEKREYSTLSQLWLRVSIHTHHFIPAKYWMENVHDMEALYLPQADNWIYTEKNKIYGFISVYDGHIAALFVDMPYQRHGIGKTLLDFVKDKYLVNLTLNVYKENSQAVYFYLKNGFIIKEEATDIQTGHQEYIMQYCNNNYR